MTKYYFTGAVDNDWVDTELDSTDTYIALTNWGPSKTDFRNRAPRCLEWVTRKRWDHGAEQRSGELRIWRTFVGRQRGAEEREVSSRFA